MMHIMKCMKCNAYTLKGFCCEKTVVARPAKFSPEDKYAHYRRKAKIEQLKREGLL